MFTLCTWDVRRQDADVAPIPAPPETEQRKVVSFRFNAEERAKLDKTSKLLAKHWGRQKVEKAEVVRVALTMLLEELEKQHETPTKRTK